MNTLTIAVLVVCATMAYASAIPSAGGSAPAQAELPGAGSDDILQAEESGWYGRGHGGGHYGHHGGGHYGHHGGHYGHHGGHYGHHGGHGGHWGK